MMIEDIIRAYINGEQLSDTESEQLNKWRNENPSNDGFIAKLERLKVNPLYRMRLESEYETVFTSLWEEVEEKTCSHKRKHFLYRTASIAAIFLLVFSVGLLRDKDNYNPQNFQGNIEPGASKAILELADGRRVELTSDITDVIEENGTKININNGEVLYTNKGNSDVLIYNSIIIPRAGEHRMELSDGTVVWVNSESTLRYPQTFMSDERRVFLSGEAYFEVRHNDGIPFIVETRGQELTVLGTEFNIYAYPDEDRILSTLISGDVRIKVKNSGEQIILHPGQQAILNEVSGSVSVITVEASEITAWKEGSISLEKMSLEEVVNILSRWYDVTFEFKDDGARRFSFRGSLPRYYDLIKVLKSLEAISPVEFVYRKNVIEIKMK